MSLMNEPENLADRESEAAEPISVDAVESDDLPEPPEGISSEQWRMHLEIARWC